MRWFSVTGSDNVFEDVADQESMLMTIRYAFGLHKINPFFAPGHNSAQKKSQKEINSHQVNVNYEIIDLNFLKQQATIKFPSSAHCEGEIAFTQNKLVGTLMDIRDVANEHHDNINTIATHMIKQVITNDLNKFVTSADKKLETSIDMQQMSFKMLKWLVFEILIHVVAQSQLQNIYRFKLEINTLGITLTSTSSRRKDLKVVGLGKNRKLKRDFHSYRLVLSIPVDLKLIEEIIQWCKENSIKYETKQDSNNVKIHFTKDHTDRLSSLESTEDSYTPGRSVSEETTLDSQQEEEENNNNNNQEMDTPFNELHGFLRFIGGQMLAEASHKNSKGNPNQTRSVSNAKDREKTTSHQRKKRLSYSYPGTPITDQINQGEYTTTSHQSKMVQSHSDPGTPREDNINQGEYTTTSHQSKMVQSHSDPGTPRKANINQGGDSTSHQRKKRLSLSDSGILDQINQGGDTTSQHDIEKPSRKKWSFRKPPSSKFFNKTSPQKNTNSLSEQSTEKKESDAQARKRRGSFIPFKRMPSSLFGKRKSQNNQPQENANEKANPTSSNSTLLE